MKTMKTLLIKLTPLEPYFLGGERIFEINDGNKHYFIRSLDAPTQTTLFGALRYLGIKNPSTDFSLDADDIDNVGGSSYRLNDDSIKSFGKITSISPLYVFSEEEGYLIRTPLDHRVKCSCGELANDVYKPFSDYSGPVIKTSTGERCFPLDYSAKQGLADSWLALRSRKIHNDLFKGTTQIGIKKNKENEDDEKSLFKKEYKLLKDGFCFAFFAEVKKGFISHDRVVYLGQGKSPFKAECKDNPEKPTIPTDLLRSGMVCAQSDIYYKGDVKNLYKYCKFVNASTRDFRVFYTDYSKASAVADRYSKLGNMKLIKSGSVFWPNNIKSFTEQIKNEHAATAGFNQIIIG